MEKLVDGHPGLHETWMELADHSLEHDDLCCAPVPPAAPSALPALPQTHEGIAPYLRALTAYAAARRAV